MGNKRKENKYRFKSFNEAISEIKVGSRKLKKIEVSDDSHSQFYSSLQTWRELNCSEQFVDCHSKLHNISESLPQVVYHKDQIVEILCEALKTNDHGTEALLDLISNLAVDLQDDIYSSFRQLMSCFTTLLRIQDASLVANVFKTIAYIYKVSWRRIVSNLGEAFDIISPLLYPPSKYYVTEFAAESFAFLMRKCGKLSDVTEFFKETLDKQADSSQCISMLFFETVRGVNKCFNSNCEELVRMFLTECQNCDSLKTVFKDMLAIAVTKISKEETSKVWALILSQLQPSNDPNFIVFLLRCINVLLEGGKFTHLSDPETVCTMLINLAPDNQSFEEDYVETLKCFICAYLQLLRYRKQDVAVYDERLLKSYLSSHKSTELLESFIDWLVIQSPFFDRYHDIVLAELSVLGIAPPYLKIISNIAVNSELRNVLQPPRNFNFTSKHKLLKQLLMKPKLPNDTVLFSLLKIMQCTTVNSGDIAKLVSKLLDDHVTANSPLYMQLEAVKTRLVIGDFDSLPALSWFLDILAAYPSHPVVLQCVYLFMKEHQTRAGAVDQVLTIETHDQILSLLKENFLKVDTSIRYLTLQILGLFPFRNITFRTEENGVVTVPCRDISHMIAAETTPLTLQTYRDKLLHCSHLRFSPSLLESFPALLIEGRILYLMGCLLWSLQPMWNSIIELLIPYTQYCTETFCTVFFKVLEDYHCETDKMKQEFLPYEQAYLKIEFSNSGEFLKSCQASNVRILMWKLLAEVSVIAESKNRLIVPYILSFRDKYNTTFGVKAQNIGITEGDSSVKQESSEGHLNDELRAHLRLLSLWTNPKACFKSRELELYYSEMLLHKQTDVQKLALECVGTFKNSSIIPYMEEMRQLVDDVNFREQLTKLTFSSPDCSIKPDHREELFRVIVRILFGKMGSRIGHAKGKGGSKTRQGIVLHYLESCSEKEVSQFINLIFERYNITDVSSDYRVITPLSVQTSYLKLAQQCVATLRQPHLKPHLPRLLHNVFTILEGAQDALKHRSNIKTFAVTPLKSIKSLAVLTLVKVLNTFDTAHFTEAQRDRLRDVAIEPNIAALPDESLQTSTPLLLLVESLAQYHVTWFYHVNNHGNTIKYPENGNILSYVLRLLVGKGVVSAVSTRVIGIIFLLLDGHGMGMEILSPHISFLAEYLHSSLHSALNTKKTKIKKKSNLPKHFKLQLELLSRLSLLVHDPSEKKNLVLSLLCLFEAQVIFRPDDIVNSANSFFHLIKDDVALSSDTVLISRANTVMSFLLTYVPHTNARVAICRYFTIINHPAAGTLDKLQAFNTNYIDDPDFETRLEGYRDIVAKVESGCYGDDNILIFLLPCISNAVYCIFTSLEMAIRDAASNSVLKVIQYIKNITSLDLQTEFYNRIIVNVVIVAIKKGIRSSDEVFQNEAIVLLQALVGAFPDKWCSLAGISDEGDPEQDFFENIRHIQIHRRTRALARLRLHVDSISVTVAWDYLLPLLEPVFSTYGGKNHNMLYEALSILTSFSLKMKWSKYLKLLYKSIKDLTKNVENKIAVKVIGALLEGFHEDISTYNKIQGHVTGDIIPKLLEFLIRNTEPPKQRSNRMSIVHEEDQVAVRAPIAIAIVSLIKQLPDEAKQTQLPPVILRVCNTLRNRAMDVRDVSRSTLSSIASDLGPNYLGYIISELKCALQKGFQLHVLANTVHHIFANLSLNPGDLDNNTLNLIIEIYVDSLTGRTAADRERSGTDHKNKLPEAKKCHSSAVFEKCASLCTISQLSLLMEPFKKMIKEVTKSKVKKKLEDVLRCMVNGILRNTLLTPMVSMVFCRELLNITPEDDQNPRNKARDYHITKKDIYLLPELPKRDAIKPKVMVSSNIHLLHEFSLQILCTQLKRGVISTKVEEQCSLLDPFVGVLIAAMSFQSTRTQVLVLRCFALLFEQPVLLPDLCTHARALSDFSLTTLRNNTRSTNTGQMMDLIFSSFKILTVILREYRDFTLSDLELKALVQYIAEDIYNTNRQATAFSLLKAILSRGIQLTEITELMDQILKLAITGQSDFVRIHSREVFMQYLLYYTIGKKIQTYIVFITKQLEYTHITGRISAIELLSMLINKLPKVLLNEFSLIVFVSLAAVLVQDEDSSCRKAAGLTIANLTKTVDVAAQEKILAVTKDWLSSKKVNYKLLGLRLIDMFLGDKKLLPPKQLQKVINTVCELLRQKTKESDEQEETKTTTHDQLTYQALLLLLKANPSHPLPGCIFDSLDELLLYPHQWVRQAAAQLLGHFLALDTTTVTVKSSLSQARMEGYLESSLTQLQSSNILPGHASQLTKNLVWFTFTSLETGDSISCDRIVSRVLKHAAVESSQDNKCTVKRDIVFKWIGATCAKVDESVIKPYLPQLLVTLQRELKNDEVPESIKVLATEVVNFLRDKYDKNVIADALVAAEKSVAEKKRKRKREAALLAISDVTRTAKRKVKVNLAKREKRKAKYLKLKSKQYASY